jgi:hypothetical protein
MYALKTRINDDLPIIGGADDLGVLSAMVTCSGHLGSASQLGKENESYHFNFSLSGLTSRAPGNTNENLIWMQRHDMKVGDVVTIEIVQVDKASATISESEVAKAVSEEREYFEHVKKAYLKLRDKFEPV